MVPEKDLIERFHIAKLVIAILGSILNAGVITLILVKKRYRKSYVFAYLNMAIADFSYAFVMASLVCTSKCSGHGARELG